MKKSNYRGFTLIELLTVIGIISILAAILAPMASKMLNTAKRTKAANNLRQIAIAYLHYATGQTQSTGVEGDTIQGAAKFLAQKAELTDPRIWIIAEDPAIIACNKPIPKTIKDLVDTNYPLSFTLVKNPQPGISPSTTPLAWTRGLSKTGKWETTKREISVYGDKGGYIAFMDGHVEWFSNLTPSNTPLLHYTKGTPTTNINKAIPTGGVLTSAVHSVREGAQLSFRAL